MPVQKRIADYGYVIGELPRGPRNKLSDVPGVRVGHATIDTERHKTGVTVVTYAPADLFTHKLEAGCFVLNGYGKTTGLVQVDELGRLECPLALTNTLNVGLVQEALVAYMLAQPRPQGVQITSLNPIVAECNDGYLNDIQERAVQAEHVFQALAEASEDFAEGDVGAGKGMSCHQLKGGIGSASRLIMLDERRYTLGALVLANHGLLHDLTLQGRAIGRELEQRIDVRARVEQGSVITLLATDAPLNERQLRRVCKRAVVGLVRVGSYVGHGSGDIMLGFSTGIVHRSDEEREIMPGWTVREERLDRLFRAAAEATEEAVLNALVTARRTIGFQGRVRESLADYL